MTSPSTTASLEVRGLPRCPHDTAAPRTGQEGPRPLRRAQTQVTGILASRRLDARRRWPDRSARRGRSRRSPPAPTGGHAGQHAGERRELGRRAVVEPAPTDPSPEIQPHDAVRVHVTSSDPALQRSRERRQRAGARAGPRRPRTVPGRPGRHRGHQHQPRRSPRTARPAPGPCASTTATPPGRRPRAQRDAFGHGDRHAVGPVPGHHGVGHPGQLSRHRWPRLRIHVDERGVVEEPGRRQHRLGAGVVGAAHRALRNASNGVWSTSRATHSATRTATPATTQRRRRRPCSRRTAIRRCHTRGCTTVRRLPDALSSEPDAAGPDTAGPDTAGSDTAGSAGRVDPGPGLIGRRSQTAWVSDARDSDGTEVSTSDAWSSGASVSGGPVDMSIRS